MNKTEKIICLILGAVLVWYLIDSMGKKPKDQPQEQAPQVQQQAAAAAEPAATPAKEASAPVAPAAKAEPTVHTAAEQIVTLENDELKLEFTTYGAAVKRAVLKRYATDCGELSDSNPPVSLDFTMSPLGALESTALPVDADYQVASSSKDSVEFVRDGQVRRYTLAEGYQLKLEESGKAQAAGTTERISIGVMRMGDNKNDLLSVDSKALTGKAEVVHHCEGDSPLKTYLVGGLAGGCSGSSSAAGMPPVQTVPVTGRQAWVAMKNRFFVTALVSSSSPVEGFDANIARVMPSADYRPESVSIKATVAPAASRTSIFYIGPKKQSLLSDLDLREVMEFGMWSWLCYPLVWVLNFFYGLIPNFGIAIILLTILVRVIFWPLTHKSTVGMKKMQELQPKMKDIQTKFKDNPQRMQQEIWGLYKAEKVNPLSSCLPMLVQIPVFIALFNVLRSAVELRYAPFLWIADLSEPEALFASWFPFGGLNLLPILMAVTTGLQSAFTPSTGDKSQQKMMMIFMPAMMLFMFYSFPSALSLYWFLSNLFSIVQMWLIRRSASKKNEALMPTEVIDPPQTRQMRRHA